MAFVVIAVVITRLLSALPLQAVGGKMHSTTQSRAALRGT